MRRLPAIVRTLLGIFVALTGLNQILHLFPTPPLAPPGAAMVAALTATGYFFPLLAVVQVVCGALLIANRAVPLALVMLAPIVIHVSLFHTILAPAPPPAILVPLYGFLVWAYWSSFRPLFAAGNPRGASSEPKA